MEKQAFSANCVVKKQKMTTISSTDARKSPNTLSKINLLQDKLNLSDDNTNEVIADLIKVITPDSLKKTKANRKKRAPKKWYDHSCYEMSRRLKTVTKLFTKSPTNPHLRGSYCKTRKDYKKLLKLKKQEWRNEMISRLETMEKERPKEYWKIINELKEKKRSETSFNTENFMKFFENLYSKTEIRKSDDKIEDFVIQALEKIKTSNEPDFTMEELNFAVNSLKNNKAPGPD